MQGRDGGGAVGPIPGVSGTRWGARSSRVARGLRGWYRGGFRRSTERRAACRCHDGAGDLAGSGGRVARDLVGVVDGDEGPERIRPGRVAGRPWAREVGGRPGGPRPGEVARVSAGRERCSGVRGLAGIAAGGGAGGAGEMATAGPWVACRGRRAAYEGLGSREGGSRLEPDLTG